MWEHQILGSLTACEKKTEMCGVRFDAPVTFFKWQEREQSMSRMAGVLDYAMGSLFAAKVVNVLEL